MKITRKILREHLKKILSEGEAIIKTTGPAVNTISQNQFNAQKIPFHLFDQIIYCPLSPESQDLINSLSNRNGTDFGNKLEPIIATAMNNTDYPGASGLNVAGGEVELVDIRQVQSGPVLKPQKSDEVNITDPLLSAKAKHSYFAFQAPNKIIKLLKAVNTVYPNDTTINASGIKRINAKLGAVFIGGHLADIVTNTYFDEYNDQTIVAIDALVIYPKEFNVAITKPFVSSVNNSLTNQSIAINALFNQGDPACICNKSSGAQSASGDKLTWSKNVHASALRCLMARICLKAGGLDSKLKLIFPKPLASGQYRGNISATVLNNRSVESTRNPLIFVNPSRLGPKMNPSPFWGLVNNFNAAQTLMLGGLYNATPPSPGNAAVGGSNSFKDITINTNSGQQTIKAPYLNPSLDTRTGTQNIVAELVNAAKARTNQEIETFFNNNYFTVAGNGDVIPKANGSIQIYISENNIAKKTKIANLLNSSLTFLGVLPATISVPNNYTAQNIKDAVLAIKNALINSSNNFFDSEYTAAKFNDHMSEWTKRYYSQDPVHAIKTNFPSFAGASSKPKLGITVKGSLEEFKMNQIDVTENTDMKIHNITASDNFSADLSKANPGDSDLFISQCFDNPSMYEIKNYLVLLQAGRGDQGALKAKQVVEAFTQAKPATPRGINPGSPPEPKSQPTMQDIANLKIAIESHNNANKNLINATQTGQKVQSTNLLKLDPNNPQDAEIVTLSLSAAAFHAKGSDAILMDADNMQKLVALLKAKGYVTENISIDRKFLKLILEYRNTIGDLMISLTLNDINLLTGYFTRLSRLINTLISNPSNHNKNMFVHASKALHTITTNKPKTKYTFQDSQNKLQDMINQPLVTLDDNIQKDFGGSELEVDLIKKENKTYENVLKELLKRLK